MLKSNTASTSLDLEILDTGKAAPAANMQKDAELLRQIRPGSKPILHLYDWEGDCATYGHFVDPYRYLSPEGVKKHNLSLAKRPTGGGIVFHITDFAFSMFVPASHPAYSINTLDNYVFVNRIVVNVVQTFLSKNEPLQLLSVEPVPQNEAVKNFCMAKPTIYDVVLDGKKVGGAAQRRTKNGFLHQGTIALCLPPESFLEEVLQPDTDVLRAMRRTTYPLVDYACLEEAKIEIKQLLLARCKIGAVPENCI